MAQAASDIVLPLSFRRDEVGGDVQDPPADSRQAIIRQLQAAPGRRLLLLIHGYNDTMPDARQAYAGFFTVQRALAGIQGKPNRPLAPDVVFVETFWLSEPGWGLFSFLGYMGSVPNAEVTGKYLAGQLAAIGAAVPQLAIDVLAHSLGARVAFEAMRQLAGGNATPGIQRLGLMAAAVATQMLESPGETHGLRRGYDAMIRRATSGTVPCLSLFSGDDEVLTWAFPAGESLTTGEGHRLTALGHGCWVSANVPDTLSQQDVPGAGHTDYWGWNPKKLDIARQAQAPLSPLFGFQHAPDAAVPIRGTATRATAPDRATAGYTPPAGTG